MEAALTAIARTRRAAGEEPAAKRGRLRGDDGRCASRRSRISSQRSPSIRRSGSAIASPPNGKPVISSPHEAAARAW
jgi:hypothetical protein